MELKEFIKTAITDITEAVSELQEEMKTRAMVNPGLDKKRECTVHFDLTDESCKKGGADINKRRNVRAKFKQDFIRHCHLYSVAGQV